MKANLVWLLSVLVMAALASAQRAVNHASFHWCDPGNIHKNYTTIFPMPPEHSWRGISLDHP
ncbi:MAG: hypothetical protein J0I12_10175 [Candidatus Eremiobacteraeota bacterium]|nr:hypothetical protein [Candidatus Eremiobacteraeota bacterium]